MADPKTGDPKGLPDHPKQLHIIVNGRTTSVDSDEVSFDQIINLAFPDGGRGDQIDYTVTFYNGGGREQEGGLSEGDSPVKIQSVAGQPLTVFNVTRTDRS